jgi:hypothetical protein
MRSAAWAGLSSLGFVLWMPLVQAAETGNLALSGSVQQVLAVSVAATAAANGLDLSLSQSPVKIADVVASSNTVTGYTVSVASANQSATRCAGSGPCFFSPSTTSTLPFALYRDAVLLSFSGASATFVQASARSAANGDIYGARVGYDGSTALLGSATDYSETLTFTIAVN